MNTRGVIHTSGMVIIAASALGLILWAAVSSGTGQVGSGQGGSPGGQPGESPNAALFAQRTKMQLAQIGLDAKALAAAGVSPNQRAIVEATASQWLANPQHTLAQTHAAYREAQKATASILRSTAATPEQKQQARATLAAAKTAFNIQSAALFAAATGGLSETQQAKLQHIQSLRWTGQPPASLVDAEDAKAAFTARDSVTAAP